MSVIYERKIPGLLQADGNETVGSDTVSGLTNAREHQISIVPEAATTGTVAVMYKPFGASAFKAMPDEFGVDVVIDIASPKDYVFVCNAEAFRFDPTGVDDTYGIALSGWE